MTEATKLERPPEVRWGVFVVDGARLRAYVRLLEEVWRPDRE